MACDDVRIGKGENGCPKHTKFGRWETGADTADLSNQQIWIPDR